MFKAKKLIMWTIAIVLIFASGCQPTPVSTPTPTGGLEGLITDASNGATIADAQVTIAGQSGVFTLASDAAGQYQGDKLIAGAYLISVQAPGYYVNAIQVGVVAGVASTANVALTPANAPVEEVVTEKITVIEVTSTPAPTAIPVPTSTPNDTPEPTPTLTPQPTATPTAAPRATARPATRPTARPTACPPTGVKYSAPQLIEPLDYTTFYGVRRITFVWEGPCCLGPDEYYVVSIPHPRGVEEGWVKGTSWTAPDYLYLLLPESKQLTWSVSIRRHTGQFANGQWTGPIVSPISKVWHFSWEIPGGQISPVSGSSTSPLSTPAP